MLEKHTQLWMTYSNTKPLIRLRFDSHCCWEFVWLNGHVNLPGRRQKSLHGKNKTEKSTIKPLYTLSVSCMKIRGGGSTPPLTTPMQTCVDFLLKKVFVKPKFMAYTVFELKKKMKTKQREE